MAQFDELPAEISHMIVRLFCKDFQSSSDLAIFDILRVSRKFRNMVIAIYFEDSPHLLDLPLDKAMRRLLVAEKQAQFSQMCADLDPQQIYTEEAILGMGGNRPVLNHSAKEEVRGQHPYQTECQITLL